MPSFYFDHKRSWVDWRFERIRTCQQYRTPTLGRSLSKRSKPTHSTHRYLLHPRFLSGECKNSCVYISLLFNFSPARKLFKIQDELQVGLEYAKIRVIHSCSHFESKRHMRNLGSITVKNSSYFPIHSISRKQSTFKKNATNSGSRKVSSFFDTEWHIFWVSFMQFHSVLEHFSPTISARFRVDQ